MMRSTRFNSQSTRVNSETLARPRPPRSSVTIKCENSNSRKPPPWLAPLKNITAKLPKTTPPPSWPLDRKKKPKTIEWLPRPESLLEERFRTPSFWEYDYGKSTQENYTQDTPSWIGHFKELRATLDHSYHGYYTEGRQQIQDDLIRDVVSGGSAKKHPWIVFTAGAMGAGKGHVVKWMSRNGHFPLPDLVQIDPDQFKAAFPEWQGYVEASRQTAGVKTRLESGYLVEIAQHVAMNEQKNVWVDGSLRDSEWYASVFNTLRSKWPEYRIAILYVYADKDVVLRRAAERAELTGREVPESELLDSMERVRARLCLPTFVGLRVPYALNGFIYQQSPSAVCVGGATSRFWRFAFDPPSNLSTLGPEERGNPVAQSGLHRVHLEQP
eukprot:1185418-Prorocentrum_minimum.AAC.5